MLKSQSDLGAPSGHARFASSPLTLQPNINGLINASQKGWICECSASLLGHRHPFAAIVCRQIPSSSPGQSFAM